MHSCRSWSLALLVFVLMPGDAVAQTGLVVSPQEVSLAVPSRSNLPATATIGISTRQAGLAYTAGVRHLGPHDSWLSVTPTTGQTPATLTLTADGSRLEPGSYLAQVTVSAGGVGGIVNVILTVSAGSGGGPLVTNPTSLTFIGQLGSTTLPARALSVTTAPGVTGPVPFRAVTTSSGWLSVTPLPLTTPVTLTVNVFQSDLPAGTYQGSISLVPVGGGAPTVVPVTFVSPGSASQPDRLTLTQTALTLTHQAGTTTGTPPVQSIDVWTSNFSFGQFTATTTSPWIRLTSTFNPAPAPSLTEFLGQQLNVAVDPAGLVIGTHVGTVQISSQGLPATELPVTLRVTGTPALNAQPSSVVLSDFSEFEQQVQVTITSTGQANLSFTAAATSTGGWLSVSPVAGSTASGFQTITIRANPTNLPIGSYLGNVTLNAQDGGSLVIPVRLDVTSSSVVEGSLFFTPQSLTLTAIAGSGVTPLQTVQIGVDGATVQDFTASASSDTGWLSVEPFTGTAPARFTVRGNSSAVPGPGSYVGTVNLTTIPDGTVYTFTVRFEVLAEGIVAVPASLNFVQVQRRQNPPAQMLEIQSSLPTNFSIFDAPAWLRLSDTRGTAPATISVWPDMSLVPPGSNNATIRIEGPRNRLLVPISITPAPPPVPTAVPDTLALAYTIGSPTSPSQTVALDVPDERTAFTVSVVTDSGARWLSVNPTSGTTPANLTVTLDPLLLTPGSQLGAIAVRFADSAQSTLTIPVEVAVTPPNAAIRAVLHAATMAPGPVAPGQIISITGEGLGPINGMPARPTPAGAFDSRLADTRVLFDGSPAPILFVRNDQINAIAPYSLDGRLSTRIQIEQGTRWSLPVDVRVVEAAPGIFTNGTSGRGPAAALNADGSANSAANPAERGSVIVVYGTGEGQTDPPGQDGRIISSDLRRPVLPVTARIGGQPADVVYFGSASSLVSGVFQANIRVPADISPGNQLLEIRVGNGQSQSGVTVSVR